MELFAIIIFGLLIFAIGRSIWWSFDHCGWNGANGVSHPDVNAKIISCTSEKVQYAKNGAKYKTTVLFSDGFYYITHKTNREQHFMTYTISIDHALKEEIERNAKKKHRAAVDKFLAKNNQSN